MNVIHWETRKVVRREQESYGDRLYLTVEIATDLTDRAEIIHRFNKAVRAKYPFDPTFCTNQHSGYAVSELNGGRGLITWETYHSIGD